MSLDCYQLRTTKHNHFAFVVHSGRIFDGAKVAQFEERPGKTYFVYDPKGEYFSHDAELEMSLRQICDYYRLNPIESFRKSGMANHYEIMGKLLTLYQAGLPQYSEENNGLEDHAMIVYLSSTLQYYPIERPGKMYLQHNDSIDPAKFEFSLRRICDYKKLQYADSFRKAGMKNHYEIMGELLNYYKIFLHTPATMAETLEKVPSSPHQITCP